jgi:5,6-dimethylbenzimidazole synthase
MAQTQSFAADSSRATEFDDAFRARLRELLVWRRDVRCFRRDPLPAETLERLIHLACLAPSVGLSQPWRFVIVEDATRRAAIRSNFERCNADALAAQTPQRAAAYARLKLAGLDDAPCQLAVFADRATAQGHGLGRHTMPEMIEYSAVTAVHTIWLAARSHGIGVGWVSILEPAAVAGILDVPADWKFIAYLCLGFPQAEDDLPDLARKDWEQRQPSAVVLRR